MGFTTSYWLEERWSRRAADTLISYGRCSNPSFLPLPRYFGIGAARLFGVEHGVWIETHGAQRRDVASGERDSGKYEGDACEGEQVGGCYTEQQTAHQVRDDERTGQTDCGSGHGQTESPT